MRCYTIAAITISKRDDIVADSVVAHGMRKQTEASNCVHHCFVPAYL